MSKLFAKLLFAKLFLLFIIKSCQGIMYMDISPDTIRCIGQELDEEDSALFTFGASHYHPIDGTSDAKQKITASIVNPQGINIMLDNNIILINSQRPLEKLIDKVNIRGVYKICYELKGGSIPVRANFHIDFKSSKDMKLTGGILQNNKIIKDDVPIAETKLQYAEESLHIIQKEIEYANIQEKLLKESTEAVSTRIQWFSMLSMAVLVITSLWQLLYLRTFFTSKKML
jgi:hypothetical protein